jgi:hypothetical protein
MRSPSRSSADHIILAIFDSVSGSRVVDVKVPAKMSLPGHIKSQSVAFEQMNIADTVTYEFT